MADYIDISIPITREMAIYPGNPGVCIEKVSSLENGDGANVSRLAMGSHTGTHIDAPLHFLPGGADVSQIPIGAMNGPVRVIEVIKREIGVSSLEAVDSGDRILFKTTNSERFDCISLLDDYVTLSYDAADYLAQKRVNLVGIDYLTIEPPRAKRKSEKSVHETLLGAGIVILEGLRLSSVEPGEYELMCLPLSMPGCDGCPVRAVLKEKGQ